MKKIFLYSLMMLSTLSFWSCKDNDDSAAGEDSNRLPRPMFICDNNTGKGDSYTYNCRIVDDNTASLYWYTVDGAAAYEIKWAVANYVANGEDAWNEAEQGQKKKSLDGHIVVADPTQFHVALEHLQYQTDFRFAIRALNSFDATGYELYQGISGVYDILGKGDASWKSDPMNSLWYGYGNGRQWWDYLNLQTAVRYVTPMVIQISDRSYTSMRINLNNKVPLTEPADKSYTQEQLDEMRQNPYIHWVDDAKTIVKIDYLTFTASYSTPDAKENPTYVKYYITEEDWDRGYIDVDGLSENSVYDIYVWDETIPYPANAWISSDQKRTIGDAGPAILINHVPTAQATQALLDGTEFTADITAFNSMKLDDIINNYYTDITLAENQVFYLEGGKAYHFDRNPDLYKGFTLRTNPEDLKQGKRAKLYLGGLIRGGGNSTLANFMLGRQPKSGENPTITMDIDSIRFMDLDVDCPMAQNIGDGAATGNYFMNMYSNGMGINVNYLEWNNCTFQGLIRGFFRIQGSNNFYIRKIKMIDCVHYNCGYYDAKGGGFNYFHADHNGKPKSNILQEVEISGNVFYDSPKGALLTDNNRNLQWDESVRWNIDIHHNTFVNFQTESSAGPLINTRYVPGGSVISVHDNVIINTKDENDTNRKLPLKGWDVRNVQGGDGSGKFTFNIYNNWTTNDPYLTKDQPFSGNAFDATSNAPKKWFSSWGETYYPHGESELTVHKAESLKATDLMVSPNPQYFHSAGNARTDHHTDTGIDGLYYKQTSEVLNSDIYQSGAGAPMLRNGK